ncbi:neural cell adhesion molecule 1-like [Sycon ciliatum]|uniref:neural cell adhesion molecule 1-like n=1 Tax=Sycon ciliatum TaxID=27933 RepID=UPI0031F6155B
MECPQAKYKMEWFRCTCTCVLAWITRACRHVHIGASPGLVIAEYSNVTMRLFTETATSYFRLLAFCDCSLAAPPRPLREMYRRRVLVSGKTSIVACKIRGYPKPQIRWARDGAVIDGGNPRYSYLSDGSLVIRHTSQVDAGHFVCMAENPLGKRNISVQVSIVGQPNMESPIIIKAPRNRKARPGGSVTLTCSAVGSNLLEINWEFLGQNLSSQPLRLRHRQLQNPHDGNGLLTVVSELVISSVSINDVGRYRCIASNLSGWTSASGELALNTQR